MLDHWLLAEEDAVEASAVEALGVRAAVEPLWMRDAATSTALAAAAFAAAEL